MPDGAIPDGVLGQRGALISLNFKAGRGLDRGRACVRRLASTRVARPRRVAKMLEYLPMSSDVARQRRAEARRKSATLTKTSLRAEERDSTPIYGAQAITLVTRLSRSSWSLSGRPVPSYPRAQIPIRFVSGRPT